MSNINYNMDNRITAGELRTLGLKIPNTIPDCGHVCCDSIRSNINTSDLMSLIDSGNAHLGIDIFIDDEFCWEENGHDIKKAIEL